MIQVYQNACKITNWGTRTNNDLQSGPSTFFLGPTDCITQNNDDDNWLAIDNDKVKSHNNVGQITNNNYVTPPMLNAV